MKWRIVRIGKAAVGIPSAEVRRLAMVVAMDYERRSRGARPDRWHWADVVLFHEGYVLVTEAEAGAKFFRLDRTLRRPFAEYMADTGLVPPILAESVIL